MARETNITEGPILSTIIKLAWPVLTSMLLEFALTITDYFWVGYLGTPEQDAVMSSLVVGWTVFAIISIIITGLTAMVSRSIGAKDDAKAAYVSGQGIQIALGMGLVFSIAGILLAPTILKFMKASPIVIGHGISYLRIAFIGMFFYFINDAVGAIFRASGDTKTPTIAFATATILNIGLDPLLIFGWGPIPSMGVSGAALATAISSMVCMLIMLTMLYAGRLGFSLSGWFKNRPDFDMMRRIIKIGLPISFQNLTFTIVYWFIIQIVHHYGDAAGAAMGIGNRMEALSFLMAFGFSVAASTLVGQNLGAQKPDRAEKCVRGTLGFIILETFIVSIFFIVIPEQIASIFSDDPAAIAIAVDYLIILGLSQIFMGIEIVLEGAFSGAGNTIPPMVVSATGSVSRLPLAWFLCFVMDIGINGVWWSLTITSFFKAIVLYIWFKRGNWKKTKV